MNEMHRTVDWPERPTAVELLSNLCGLFMDPSIGDLAGHDLPAAIPLQVLPQLGISANAVRMALSRHVERGLLVKTRTGRSAAYAITDAGRQIIGEDGTRVRARAPFAAASAVWTLVSFSVPEERRDLRTRLRTQLTQCGFRPLRDGLWVALDSFSAELVTRRLDPDMIATAKIDIFIGTSHLSGGLSEFIEREWNTEELRTAHQRFLERWEHVDAASLDALPTLTLLGAEWLALLKKDPGLSSAQLGTEWPGDRSAATAWRLYESLQDDAAVRLKRMVGQSSANR